MASNSEISLRRHLWQLPLVPTPIVTPVVKEKALAFVTDIWLALALLLPTPQVMGTPSVDTSHRIMDFARLPGIGAVAFIFPKIGCPYSRNSKSAQLTLQSALLLSAKAFYPQLERCKIQNYGFEGNQGGRRGRFESQQKI